MIAVGLMSGTSLDGIDAALVRLVPRGQSYEVDLLDFQTTKFEEADRHALENVLPPNGGSTRAVAELHSSLGDAFAQAALRVAGEAEIDFVASHGQTIYHDGNARTTLQIGDPFRIREAVNRTVCYDFAARIARPVVRALRWCRTSMHCCLPATPRIASRLISAELQISPSFRVELRRPMLSRSIAVRETC